MAPRKTHEHYTLNLALLVLKGTCFIQTIILFYYQFYCLFSQIKIVFGLPLSLQPKGFCKMICTALRYLSSLFRRQPHLVACKTDVAVSYKAQHVDTNSLPGIFLKGEFILNYFFKISPNPYWTWITNTHRLSHPDIY